jgi:hypothetical protein
MMLMPTFDSAQDDPVLKLPAPETSRNTLLTDGLEARKSSWEFSGDLLPLALVSSLL